MNFEWNNLDINVINKNTSINTKYLNIIKKSGGKVQKGEFLAIMGPSGGGKTTLISVLSGRVPLGSLTKGKILYNGEPRRLKEWINTVGFVDQDDVFHDNFSIEETFKFTAHLRLNKSKLINKSNKSDLNGKFSFEEFVNKKVENIINLLKLDDCSKNKIKKISGGERKRVMIGIELISDPDVLFLDEPTSGLDASMAYSICQILKNLAVERNKIIIITIHQPSSDIFNLFDHLILLSKGITLYNGKISDINNHLKESKYQRKIGNSDPESIIDFCNQKENESIVDDRKDIGTKEITGSLSKKSNEAFINIKLNLYHVYILMKRLIYDDIYRKKWNFTKTHMRSSLFYIACGFFVYFNMSLLLKNPIFLGMNLGMDSLLLITNDTQKFQEYLTPFLKAYLLRNICIIFYSAQIYIISLLLIDKVRIYRREIIQNTFSITSLYSSYFLYCLILTCIIQSIHIIIFNIIVKIIQMKYGFEFREVFNVYNILTLYIIPIISISISLCIASFSNNKNTIISLQTFFCMKNFLHPKNLHGIIILLENINYMKLSFSLKIFSYFMMIFPEIHLFILIENIIYKNMKDSYKYDQNIIDFYDKHYENSLRYFKGIVIPTKATFVFLAMGLVIFIALGIYFLGKILMPNFRMKLEKDVKN